MADRGIALDVMFGKRKDLDKMTKEEMKKELEVLRVLWDWVDDSVKELVARVGQMVRIWRRDYKSYTGHLLDCKFELKEVNIEVAEKVWDSNTGSYIFERKVIRVPVNAILHYEWILESEEWIEPEVENEEILGNQT